MMVKQPGIIVAAVFMRILEIKARNLVSRSGHQGRAWLYYVLWINFLD